MTLLSTQFLWLHDLDAPFKGSIDFNTFSLFIEEKPKLSFNLQTILEYHAKVREPNL